ncbi:hypothetical protein F5883DRAFT_232378 [Diaporthe sp. PMI_573]|nr:hypothetical protein F5883DRAFT_232378 [Diaporthaceae sp. PMI_573]
MNAVALKPRVHEDLGARFIPPCPTISFRHPGYADPDNILFELPRLDQTEHGPATGIHHRTALQACQIIANNAFHGFLATDRDGQQAVTVPTDGVLTEDSYWFIVERRDGDGGVEQRQGRNVYPIVPSFEDWQFPHGGFSNLGWNTDDADTTATPGPGPTLPPDAPTTSLPKTSLHPSPVPPIAIFAVPAVPRHKFSRCVLSNYDYSITKAHLVPSANINWFRINSMRLYEDKQQSMRFIHNTRNILTIRADLHTMWDTHTFTLVPKQGRFVAHVLTALTPGGREFAAEWHNRPTQRNALEGVAKQYMFAKFAQAIFMLLKPFVAFAPLRRYVARLRAKAAEEQDGEEQEFEVQREWLSGAALQDLYSGGGSRRASESPSSRKRSRSETSADDDEDDDESEWPPQQSIRANLWAEESDEEEERGRPRKRRQRSGRSEHTVDTLPSLTDTSVVDLEESLDDSWSASYHPWPPKPPDYSHKDGLIGESRGKENRM